MSDGPCPRSWIGSPKALVFALPILVHHRQGTRRHCGLACRSPVPRPKRGQALAGTWLRTPWMVAASGLLGPPLGGRERPCHRANADSFSRALPFLRFILFAAALQHWLLVTPKAVRTFLKVLAFTRSDSYPASIASINTGRASISSARSAEGEYRLSGPFNNDVAGTFLAKVSLPLIGWWLAWSAQRGHLSWSIGGTLGAPDWPGDPPYRRAHRPGQLCHGTRAFWPLAVKSHQNVHFFSWALSAFDRPCGDHYEPERASPTLHRPHHIRRSRIFGTIVMASSSCTRSTSGAKPRMAGVGLKNFRLTCDTGNFEHIGGRSTPGVSTTHTTPISKCSRRPGRSALSFFSCCLR